jgi:hypothetical protein
MIQEAVSGVLAAQRDWLAAVRAKNIDALMLRVTDDIAVIHPNGKTVRGADELLFFKKGASRATQSLHDGDGELYLAFAIPIRRIGQLGVVAPNEGNRSGREAEVGIGRLEPVLSRPGPPFNRTRPRRAHGRSTEKRCPERGTLDRCCILRVSRRAP